MGYVILSIYILLGKRDRLHRVNSPLLQFLVTLFFKDVHSAESITLQPTQNLR